MVERLTGDVLPSGRAASRLTDFREHGALPCRGERLEKYNQLMRIEEDLGKSAVYIGRKGFIR